MNTSILIADDHTMFRSGMRSLLEQHPGFKVAGEAATGREAVALAQRLMVDVVVMDLMMPELNGIEATRQIHAHRPETAIVALSATASGPFIGQVLRLGALGFVPKTAVIDELIDAVQSARRGDVFLSRCIAGAVVDCYIRGGEGQVNAKRDGAALGDSLDENRGKPDGRAPGDEPEGVGGVYDHLTPREREVLQLIAEGVSTKMIAHHLRVSPKTVESHRQTMMRKLDLSSVAHLTKYAVREGLTSLD